MKTVTTRGARHHQVSGPDRLQSAASADNSSRHGRGTGSSPRSRRSEPEVITETWKQYKSEPTPQLRDELVNYYMDRHVRLIAERFRSTLPPSVDVDDLIQQGFLGLLRSIDRFQLDRGTRFETFSSLRIIGAMRDWLREQDHIPRQVRQRARAIGAAVERFQVMFGRAPDAMELVEVVDLPIEDALITLSAARPPAMVTFSTVTSTADPEAQEMSELAGLTNDHPSTSPLHDLTRDDLRRWVTRELDTRDQLIVVLYYYEDMTMREIGLALGCSESRVSQRLHSILMRLRARFACPHAAAQLEPLE